MSSKFARSLGGVFAAAVLVIGVAACQKSDTGSNNATKCEGKIAFMGALTGADAGAVIPSHDAVKLAFKKFSAENKNCKVELVDFDTQGDPAQATPAANKIAPDQAFIGVIGGAFSGESKATMPIYEAAGLAMVSQSATNPDLTKTGNKAFHRVVGNDSTQGAAAAVYIKTNLKATKAFVIDDGSTYGAGIAKVVKDGIGAIKAGEDTVQKGQTNFDATIGKIKAIAGVDAIAFAGYTGEGAPLLKQIRSNGINVPFIGFDGVYDPAFASGAGAAAEGAIITCPCLPADKSGGTFVADFKAEYGKDPGAYGAEGYDAATVFLSGIKAGKVTRADMLAWVNNYDAKGLSKDIKFDSTGEVDKSKVTVWAYEIKGGAIVAKAEIKLS